MTQGGIAVVELSQHNWGRFIHQIQNTSGHALQNKISHNTGVFISINHFRSWCQQSACNDIAWIMKILLV